MHKYEIARPTRICCSYVSYYSLLATYSCTHVDHTMLCSSQFIVYGRDPVLPMDTLLQPRPKYMGEDYVPCTFMLVFIFCRNAAAFCSRCHLVFAIKYSQVRCVFYTESRHVRVLQLVAGYIDCWSSPYDDQMTIIFDELQALQASLDTLTES